MTHEARTRIQLRRDLLAACRYANAFRGLQDVRLHAAVVSLLLSAWYLHLDNVINNDGVLYLRVAELIANGAWSAAFDLFQWPFYPALIAGIGHVTGLGLENAAHALDAVFGALIVVAFIEAVQILGADRRTVILAAMTILLYPGLNQYRSFVIRDFGYLAFYLIGLALLFRDLKAPDWRARFAGASSFLISGLFRIEGMVLFLALPLLSLALRARRTPAEKLRYSALFGGVVLALLLSSWWLAGAPRDVTGSERLIALIGDGWTRLASGWSERITSLQSHVLPKYAADHATLILGASMLTILLAEVIGRVTVVYAFLAGHAWFRKLIFPLAGARALWLGLMAVHVAILIAVLLTMFFLTGRFPLALSLTVLLAVPFGLADLYQRWRERRGLPLRKNWVFPAVCVLLLLTVLPGLTAATHKGHLREAGMWLRENAPAGSSVFGNDIVLLHYSRKEVFERARQYDWQATETLVRSGRWRNFDYLAIAVTRRESGKRAWLLNSMKETPVKVFHNQRGDEVFVFAKPRDLQR